LIFADPDLLEGDLREEVRARKLWIARELFLPIVERVDCEINFARDRGIGRMLGGRNSRVAERIVDPEKAELELSEILICRRHSFEFLA